MMPEAQRIAIAEALGWQGMDFATNNVTDPKGHKHFFNSCLKSWEDFVPDYLQDLNAMHEAEKTLNEVDRVTYFRQLETIVDRDVGRVIAFAVGDATASQRAEAFLTVKGLWK